MVIKTEEVKIILKSEENVVIVVKLNDKVYLKTPQLNVSILGKMEPSDAIIYIKRRLFIPSGEELERVRRYFEED